MITIWKSCYKAIMLRCHFQYVSLMLYKRCQDILVEDVMKIKLEDYDKLVIAELHGSEALNQVLSDLGVPEQKIVTFFATNPSKNGRNET